MTKFSCVCGTSCAHFKRCKRTQQVMRPCGRSNPKLGDARPSRKRTSNAPRERPVPTGTLGAVVGDEGDKQSDEP